MHKIPLQRSSVFPITRTDSEEILHFSLEGLLPPRHTLALNTTLGTLSLLSCSRDQVSPCMLMQQQFTTSELSVLLPLLKLHPHYCPYEIMLASFNYGNTTESVVTRSRERLHEAQQEGIWDQEMRPVRNVLSRARLKMHTFSIEISSILETGYVLMHKPERRRMRSAGIAAAS